jgi:hypothetical protein
LEESVIVRVFGITLVLVAVASGLLALLRPAVPFRVPLTASDAAYCAVVLLIAGVLAFAAGDR